MRGEEVEEQGVADVVDGEGFLDVVGGEGRGADELEAGVEEERGEGWVGGCAVGGGEGADGGQGA